MSISRNPYRLLAHWRVVLLCVGLGLAGSLAANSLSQRMDQVELRTVRIEGRLQYLDAKALEESLSTQFAGRFLDMALSEVMAAVTSHPWIADATVRRVWPDTLVIEVIEQQPVAIYNDTLYLGTTGDLFAPPNLVSQPLPALYGNLNETRQVFSHYRAFTDRLADVSPVAAVARGGDLGWDVLLENGVRLKLGRENLLGRLSRASEVLETLTADEQARVQTLDARYSDGVSIAWRDAP